MNRDEAITQATEGISEPIAQALRATPREHFVPQDLVGQAYDDHPLPLPEEQSLPAMRITAVLLEALAPAPGERVLHVGAGTGYTAALLARLCGEVHAVERIPAIAGEARQRLQALGLSNVTLHEGEGALGCPKAAPFDGILMPLSSEGVPQDLLEQLAPGGRIIIAVGEDRIRRQLFRVCRTPQGFDQENLGVLHLASRLGDILVALGAAQRADVEDAATLAESRHVPIGAILTDETPTEERDVYRALALQRGLDYAELDEVVEDLDPGLSERVPAAFLKHNRIVPVSLSDDGVLHVVTDNPAADFTGLEQVTGARSLQPFLITPTDYKRITTAFALGATSIAGGDDDNFAGTPDLMDAGSDQRIVALLEALLLEAVGERASDIHFERYGDRVRIRLRVDGELRDLKHFQLSPAELVGIVSVIKINAELDIAERRLPQGGRFRRRLGGRVFDMRVQTQPALYGEHVVIRLLPQDTALLSIEDLGMPPAIAKQYRRLLFSPAGLVLVVGPTGSGKSTTLYAGLQVLAEDASRKVITAEDPVEYSINGVQQTPIKAEIGFPFHQAMRAFVRQDPDVILVGEIRDSETALEAIRASQTGHLVLSTLHANDTLDAIQRLFDLDMHPNSIASELLAVFAQRLAKRICTRCKIPDEAPDPEILTELFPDGDAPADLAPSRGRGCVRCHGAGTYGRVGVIEFLRTAPPIRKAISHHLPTDEMRRVALEAGLRTMRESALDLVRAGLIPLSELPRILPAERMAPER